MIPVKISIATKYIRKSGRLFGVILSSKTKISMTGTRGKDKKTPQNANQKLHLSMCIRMNVLDIKLAIPPINRVARNK
jgi:hypothetical protein